MTERLKIYWSVWKRTGFPKQESGWLRVCEGNEATCTRFFESRPLERGDAIQLRGPYDGSLAAECATRHVTYADCMVF